MDIKDEIKIIEDDREPELRLNRVEIDDVVGLFEVVDTVPTKRPTSLKNQIKIYNNAGTKRLYWYDPKNDVWAYASGT